MRMWNVSPALMCPQHRTGEHFELHQHRHLFVKRHSIAGRVAGPVTLIEPLAMKRRHDELAATLRTHKSPYEMPDLSYLPPEHREARVDVAESLRELARRCPDCRRLILAAGLI